MALPLRGFCRLRGHCGVLNRRKGPPRLLKNSIARLFLLRFLRRSRLLWAGFVSFNNCTSPVAGSLLWHLWRFALTHRQPPKQRRPLAVQQIPEFIVPLGRATLNGHGVQGCRNWLSKRCGCAMRFLAVVLIRTSLSLAACGKDPGPKGDSGP
jgi:hypothetical protein